ncbi:MAG TPA: NAD-dependent epimerase/dehydratase family protein, partial [Candidatus Poseidoniales archaeon]
MHENSVKTFLVTGGSGFIGQHLVNKLVSNGHHVIVVDNHLTSVPGASSSSVRLIEKNISDLDIDDLPPLDGIYHLASIAAPRLFREHAMMVIHP